MRRATWMGLGCEFFLRAVVRISFNFVIHSVTILTLLSRLTRQERFLMAAEQTKHHRRDP